MEVQLEQPAEEIKRLQHCTNDLVSLLAIPAMWSGQEPTQIVSTLLDVLLAMVRLDFAYARVKDSFGEAHIEMVRVAQPEVLIQQEISEALNQLLGDNSQNWPQQVPNPSGDGVVSLFPLRLGLQGEIGVIVAGSGRPGFPVETERLLLRVAANQAVIWLQEERLLKEQKRITRELDERVAQRTRELAAANEDLRTAVEEIKALKDQLYKENVALREEINQASMFEEIVGSSEALRRVLFEVGKVAPTDSTVMIFGETGTGKELVARAIHRRSRRSGRAFIRVNCAAIPPSLIASELFGHEKGAFTGALQRRAGRFESADGGTIFLDEIGELSLETQVSLLRVLQEREFERVGSSHPTSVDVRVLAATNRDLEAAVVAGTFRQDLFYRLNVFPIRVPALRERKDDIPVLVEYLVERYAKKAGKKISQIKKRTLDLFQAYDWPGNIRELQNVVERAVILCDGETFSVDTTWLQRKPSLLFQRPVSPAAVLAKDKKEFAERERKAIEAALAECQGRVAGPRGAAAKLGIPRQTVEWKIASLGIDKRRFKTQSPSG
jgi:transcriptional regulator with GAF, ATPase, and Fis domain